MSQSGEATPPAVISRITHPSNYGNGAGANGINKGRQFIVMHGTGKHPSSSADDEIRFLSRENARVSYHYYVTKDGRIFQLVPDEARAWHAGSSRFLFEGVTYTDLNDWSIGVAFESSNGVHEVYPAPQVRAAMWLVDQLLKKYDLCADSIVTHREISDPPGRKIDPVNFDIHSFRSALHGPAARRIPAYHPVTNEYLGDITIIEDSKGYPGWLKP